MTTYETWAHVVMDREFYELTGDPVIAKLEYSGTDPDAAQEAADKAVKRVEVLAATVRVIGE